MPFGQPPMMPQQGMPQQPMGPQPPQPLSQPQPLAPQADMQRNAITEALMNIRQPQPQTPGMPPQGMPSSPMPMPGQGAPTGMPTSMPTGMPAATPAPTMPMPGAAPPQTPQY